MAKVIGTLAEKSLHAALKAHYAQPGDQFECALDGYVIDILRPEDADPRCIEIQTRHLGSMKRKLATLLNQHTVQVVHPIAQTRTITRIDADGVIRQPRKSPKRGTFMTCSPNSSGCRDVVQHPNFRLEVVLIREEQIWLDDGQGSWRRKHWSISDRKLIEVVGALSLPNVADFAALLPAELPSSFDTKELAALIRQPRRTAQKMAYCLREMGVVEIAGKRGNALLYRRTDLPDPASLTSALSTRSRF